MLMLFPLRKVSKAITQGSPGCILSDTITLMPLEDISIVRPLNAGASFSTTFAAQRKTFRSSFLACLPSLIVRYLLQKDNEEDGSKISARKQMFELQNGAWLHPNSNVVTPKIRFICRGGGVPVYMRAVSKTRRMPCRSASCTAESLISGASRNSGAAPACAANA